MASAKPMLPWPWWISTWAGTRRPPAVVPTHPRSEPKRSNRAPVLCAVLSNSLRHDEAIVEVERGCTVDPLAPIMHTFAATMYGWVGRYDAAFHRLAREYASRGCFSTGCRARTGGTRSVPTNASRAFCVGPGSAESGRGHDDDESHRLRRRRVQRPPSVIRI
jgi:hypothetical protein